MAACPYTQSLTSRIFNRSLLKHILVCDNYFGCCDAQTAQYNQSSLFPTIPVCQPWLHPAYLWSCGRGNSELPYWCQASSLQGKRTFKMTECLFVKNSCEQLLKRALWDWALFFWNSLHHSVKPALTVPEIIIRSVTKHSDPSMNWLKDWKC